MLDLVPHRLPLLALLTIALPTGVDAQDGEGHDLLDWRPFPEALAVAQASDVPALVYVRAAWCGPCRRLDRETFGDDTVRQRLGRFALTRLTPDDRDRQHRVGPYRLSEAEWVRRLGAEASPTLVVLSPDGAVIGRHVGFLPPDGLLPLLDAALSDVALSDVSSR